MVPMMYSLDSSTSPRKIPSNHLGPTVRSLFLVHPPAPRLHWSEGTSACPIGPLSAVKPLGVDDD
eukprot:3141825-Heterocapsa_arctica.AAC.1